MKTLDKQAYQKYLVFPKLIKLIRKDADILFFYEVVFSDKI